MNVNFQHTELAEPREIIPPGRYLCELIEVWDDRRYTQQGNPYWVLTFEVAEGPFTGARLYTNAVFSEAAMPRVKRIFTALGLPESYQGKLSPDLVVGQRCLVQVKHRLFEGEIRATPTFAGFDPIDEDQENRESAPRERGNGRFQEEAPAPLPEARPWDGPQHYTQDPEEPESPSPRHPSVQDAPPPRPVAGPVPRVLHPHNGGTTPRNAPGPGASRPTRR